MAGCSWGDCVIDVVSVVVAFSSGLTLTCALAVWAMWAGPGEGSRVHFGALNVSDVDREGQFQAFRWSRYGVCPVNDASSSFAIINPGRRGW